LLFLLSPVATAGAGSLIEMSVEAGLNEKFRNAAATELRVEVVSARSIPARLIIDDRNGTSIHHLQLTEHQRETYWIGVWPQNDGMLTLTLSPEPGDPIVRTLSLSPVDEPITLVTTPTVRKPRDEGGAEEKIASTILLLSSNLFPYTREGYASVQAIIADLPTLSNLNARQSKALGAYLATCGILLLDSPPALILERLTIEAGCGGHFIRGFDKLSDIPTLLRTLHTQAPPTLPGLSALQRLATPQPQLPVFIFLSAYLLLMLTSVMLTRHSLLVLFIPLLCAAAGLVAWYGTGEQRLMLWAETASGDPLARYSALLIAGGNRRGLLEIGLAGDTKLMTGNPSANSSTKHILEDGRYRINAHSALFGPAVYQLSGIIHQPRALRLNLSDEGPMVSNLGPTPSPRGWLLWQNRSYRVPPLMSEQHWLPDNPGHRIRTPAEQLLGRRLAYADAALLYPLAVESKWIAPTARQEDAWLVIRPEPGDSR
jgi:hypothetical protein